MARTQISIKLDEDLLARIDQLAAEVGTTRTAVIEKAVENDLPQQEAFHKSLENPVVRAIHERITSPGVLRLLARLADEPMTDDEINALVERAPAQRAAAKQRKADRSGIAGQTPAGMEGA